jgi:peptide/nickel transport system permease protein
MPSLALAGAMGAVTMRMTAAAMDDVLSQDYVRTARAKGLAPSRVLFVHALRNAMVPILTVIGIQLGRMLGGAIVVENVFNWPGVGTLLVRSITERDYPVIQGTVLMVAFFFVVSSLIVDVGVILLSPQARRGL